jgi:hypothetical protein
MTALHPYEYLIHTLVYIILYIWECHLLSTAPWLGTDNYNDDPWQVPSDKNERNHVALLFYTQILWYAYSFGETLALGRRRKDFYMMLLHHLVTPLLIAGAYLTHTHRIAMIVLFNQDPGDILLNLAKAVHRLLPAYKGLHTWLLTLLALTWFMSRILTLAVIVFLALWHATSPLQLVLAGVLAGIWVMQLVWGKALLDLCVRVWNGEQVRDTMEHSD